MCGNTQLAIDDRPSPPTLDAALDARRVQTQSARQDGLALASSTLCGEVTLPREMGWANSHRCSLHTCSASVPQCHTTGRSRQRERTAAPGVLASWSVQELQSSSERSTTWARKGEGMWAVYSMNPCPASRQGHRCGQEQPALVMAWLGGEKPFRRPHVPRWSCSQTERGPWLCGLNGFTVLTACTCGCRADWMCRRLRNQQRSKSPTSSDSRWYARKPMAHMSRRDGTHLTQPHEREDTRPAPSQAHLLRSLSSLQPGRDADCQTKCDAGDGGAGAAARPLPGRPGGQVSEEGGRRRLLLFC